MNGVMNVSNLMTSGSEKVSPSVLAPIAFRVLMNFPTVARSAPIVDESALKGSSVTAKPILLLAEIMQKLLVPYV